MRKLLVSLFALGTVGAVGVAVPAGAGPLVVVGDPGVQMAQYYEPDWREREEWRRRREIEWRRREEWRRHEQFREYRGYPPPAGYVPPPPLPYYGGPRY